MHCLGSASEADMVLAFVQAEWESPRFGPLYERQLRQLGLQNAPRTALATFLFHPDQHAVRAWLLGQCRGFGLNRFLFQGFPSDVNWTRWAYPPNWFAAQRYARFKPWLKLTQGSLQIQDGVDRLVAGLATDLAGSVTGVIERLTTDWQPPSVVVLVDTSGEAIGQAVLVEGHTRATAYALRGGRYHYPVLVGQTCQLSRWAHL